MIRWVALCGGWCSKVGSDVGPCVLPQDSARCRDACVEVEVHVLLWGRVCSDSAACVDAGARVCGRGACVVGANVTVRVPCCGGEDLEA